MGLKDTHMPLNSIIIIMESFYIIDTFYKKKRGLEGMLFIL